MNYDQDDVHNLALCVWKEARGEGEQGMQAVANVIVNRVGHPGFAHTLHDCVYGKNQFTSMSVPSDPEFNLEPLENDNLFLFAINMSGQILSGKAVDITNGAHYYANLVNTTSGWFFRVIVSDTVNHKITAKIGHHTFFF